MTMDEIEKTIDGHPVLVDHFYWDYDLRICVVTGRAHISHGVIWYSTIDPFTGNRGSDFDASRLWKYHPSHKVSAEAAFNAQSS